MKLNKLQLNNMNNIFRFFSSHYNFQAFNDEFTKKFTTQSAASGATTAAATAKPKGPLKTF